MSNTEALQKDLDVDRYMGTWYEIAKYPTVFQVDCQRSVAVYEKLSQDLRDRTEELFCNTSEGSIFFSVLNKCMDTEGNVRRTISGVGEIRDKNNPAVISVSFEGVPDSGSSEGNYLVHYTNYKYAVVGSPDKSTLFILARDPVISESMYTSLKNRVRNLGYSPEKLVIDSGAVEIPRKSNPTSANNMNIFKMVEEASHSYLWWFLLLVILLFLLIAAFVLA